ncbi:hypothetical protein PVAP13_5KG701150 [Panicum virgatum]|uniref:Uncharacterized protein n=1 Tax=Panicum virgatum TaxID=38727 RepID=A0A8T0SV01_PANVG|nr:hypothetical protein PVAP13_5KG701150 [Panicum virgatum]
MDHARAREVDKYGWMKWRSPPSAAPGWEEPAGKTGGRLSNTETRFPTKILKALEACEIKIC